MNEVIPGSPTRIDDPADPRLDDFRDLRQPGVRRARESGDFLVAEGPNVVRRLLQSGLHVRAVLLAESKVGALDDVMVAAAAAPDAREGDEVGVTAPRFPVYVVSREVLTTVAGFDLHRGVVASADRPSDAGLAAVVARAATTHGTIAVLEGLNDHENLGAIARSARGLGIQALVLDPTCADPWYRRTVRVSMGEILHLPIARCSSMSEALAALRRAGVVVAALTPNPSVDGRESVDIHTWTRPDSGVALVLGAEGPGLPADTLVASDVRLRIPISSDVDSLNVGHAAAIAFAMVSRPDISSLASTARQAPHSPR
jgi:tRNA G18 (ribose-2'-O)-methylase SpoU